MTDEPKDTKKISKIGSDKLTPKQRNFVNALVKGKVKSIKEAYAKSYEVKLNEDGTIPKWCSVEASKLMANNPNITQALERGIKQRESSVLASHMRTKNYVLERLLAESKEADRGSERIKALELLGKSIAMFTDNIQQTETRSVGEIEEEIEERINRLLND